jgi:hypothetical protein
MQRPCPNCGGPLGEAQTTLLGSFGKRDPNTSSCHCLSCEAEVYWRNGLKPDHRKKIEPEENEVPVVRLDSEEAARLNRVGYKLIELTPGVWVIDWRVL